MSSATPRPWKYIKDQPYNHGRVYIITVPDHEEDRPIALVPYSHAELIVRAVNAHDALVSALEDAANRLDGEAKVWRLEALDAEPDSVRREACQDHARELREAASAARAALRAAKARADKAAKAANKERTK